MALKILPCVDGRMLFARAQVNSRVRFLLNGKAPCSLKKFLCSLCGVGHLRQLQDMNVAIRRIVVPFIATIVLWAVTTLVLTSGFEIILGHEWAAGMTPFSSVHLREVALEGVYSPLADVAFIVHAVLVGLLVFALVTFLTAKREGRPHLLLAILPAFLGIGAFALWFRFVWDENYPFSMRIAFVVQLVIYVCCALAGFVLASLHVGVQGADDLSS
jgi:hypothetical protein